jgi:hypothetical protein
MVLRARWEGIHQKVDIAGRVEILAADCHRGRGRDTAGPDFREPSLRNCPKRGGSNTSTVDLAGVRTPKWAEKYHFGVP